MGRDTVDELPAWTAIMREGIIEDRKVRKDQLSYDISLKELEVLK